MAQCGGEAEKSNPLRVGLNPTKKKLFCQAAQEECVAWQEFVAVAATVLKADFGDTEDHEIHVNRTEARDSCVRLRGRESRLTYRLWKMLL